MGRHGARRTTIATVVVGVCAVAALASAAAVGGVALQPQPAQTTHDIVVAGGIDGRVYAMNAWTGDVLWMFDSGGPMVDFSDCGVRPPTHASPWRTASTRSASATDGREADDNARSLTNEPRRHGDDAIARSANGVAAAALSQVIPSYDGRLYHIDGANVRELGTTMIDLINANGPVRLATASAPSTPASTDDKDSTLSDLLLFGEKETKIFSLDAVQGIIQPFLTTSQSATSSPTILFGRAEFKTRAVHARNMSAARCFTFSEYFLEFAHQSKCARNADEALSSSPHILVLPKDPDASKPEEEESTIAAYDPWTNKQLWEIQIPKFDVTSVYGVSATRGVSFFTWNVDGPSSSTQAKKDLVPSRVQPDSTIKRPLESELGRPLLGHDQASESSNESKHLVKTVSREMSMMESQFRLRLLDGNYYLEPNPEDEETTASAASNKAEAYNTGFPKRKRRVFWESMESDGKKGVFITYYHVGAMTLGTMVGCMLIAWGFYVKGLSASGMIHSIEHHNFEPTRVIHELRIEQPGHNTITISSSITRERMLEAAVKSGYFKREVPLLENGDKTFTGANNNSLSTNVKLDSEGEALLMENLTKFFAMEAAAALAGSRFSSSNLLQLQSDPNLSNASTSSSSTLTLSPDTSSSRPHRRSILADESIRAINVTTFESSCSNMTEDNEGRMVPVIEELECSSSEMVFESTEGEENIEVEEDPFLQTNDVAENTNSSMQSGPKSGVSWVSDTTGSSKASESSSSSGDDSAGASSDFSEASSQRNEDDSASAAEISNPRKASNASSSSSTPNEAEVLFPFVCQSRFANEFVELSALGKGGFGQVMLAENRLDGRKYAIKRVGLHLKNQTSKTLQKFLREVKILALLDHPHIVRYYQAWLEKVEEGEVISSAPFSDGGSEVTGTVAPRNYSMSNLLAPVSEMEYSNQRSVASFYSNGSIGEDDGGFDWDRNSGDGEEELNAWREEDLAPSGQSPPDAQHAMKQRIIEPNKPPKAPARAARATDREDSSCYSVDRCDHWLYIQMQYCAGRNLGDYLALPTRTMELPKLLKIFTQIASAIAHVHSCGLIHRDLKPANIFVADTEGDSIKLGDFGLSRYAANVNLSTASEEHAVSAVFSNGAQGAQYSMSKWSVSMSNMSESQDITAGVGTYLYASPEQVAGKKYNAKTDMYSLGMILFELCHERFGTTMERYVTLRNARERLFPPEFVWRKKCPEIMDMLERLLHHDAMARPDAADVVNWSQELYEISLAQHHHHHHSSSLLRSPIHQSRSFQGAIPTLGLDNVAATTAFSLQVEARMDAGADDSGSGSGSSGERRLPNHNLLKELCDVIADVSGGRMEIKKCGLHIQDGGAQILDFVLDPHLSEDEKEDAAVVDGQKTELIKTIEALPGVHTVRLGR